MIIARPQVDDKVLDKDFTLPIGKAKVHLSYLLPCLCAPTMLRMTKCTVKLVTCFSEWRAVA